MSETLLRSRRRPRERALIVLLVVLIVGLAVGLRFHELGRQSLWADEGNSAVMAARSLAQIAGSAANDIHPPLYYWLLRLWVQFAGVSEAGLRSLSAVLGALLVLVTIGLGMRLGGGTCGLVAGMIAAVSPFQIHYSQEARMYILLALEAAVAAYGFWWLVAREDRRLPDGSSDAPGSRLKLFPPPILLLALAFVAGLYTHYAFPIMIALLSALYLAWVIVTRQRGQVGRRLLRWGLPLGIALVCFAPWLATAVRQISGWPTGGQATEPLKALSTALLMLSLGPTGLLSASEWWVWIVPALALVGIVPWPGLHRRPAWLSWLLPVAWLAAPLGMMLALGLFRDAYLKFLLLASPAYTLLLASAVVGPALRLGRLGRRTDADPEGRPAAPSRWDVVGGVWAISALMTIVILCGFTLNRYYADPKAARDDYRGIAQFIAATARPNDAILLVAPGQAEVFDYYYKGDLPVFALPGQRPIDRAATEKQLNELLARDKIYAVYWANQEADPGDFIQGWMNTHGYKTLDQWRGNARLAVYVMPERRPTGEKADTLNLPLGSDILLQGFRGGNPALAAGEVSQLQLIWQALKKPARRYKAFLQLLDATDQVIAQRDSEPVGDGRPTDTWEPGEVISDNHGVLIPPGTPPGDYRRIVGLYDRETGERLRLPDGKDHISLPPVRVMRAGTPPPLAALNMMHDQQFDFGAVKLLGHDRYKRGFGHAPETPLYPGDRLHFTPYWQANVRSRADWWFDLELNDNSGHTVANLRWPLVSATYPTTLWAKGEVVRGEHDLQLPSDLPPGDYRLSLTMYPDAETEAGVAYLGTLHVSRPTK
ncbi:MAG: glycosyltransferase family 39 protein [Anaerolineae bacterium]|jgi:uncharacterized membrane protein|nr:glycosyltransferase family 39 protein [Anaerolineae bacterium]